MSRVAQQKIAQERSHTLIVGSGLYVLRYVSSDQPNDCPFVAVSPSPKDRQGIALISAPGGSDSGLAAPGECVVVRAESPGALDLTVRANRKFGSLDAELRLERIEYGDTSSAHPVSQDIPPTTLRSGADVSILAHVARRGDIVCRQGEWIGGPDLPMPVEGIEIQWANKPSQVDIRCVVTVKEARQKRTLDRHVGQFAGTRGKAAPLVGLRLALRGPLAAKYQLQVDALFLGTSIVSKSGCDLSFSGPTGSEPLVGLRLTVCEVETPKVPEMPKEASTVRAIDPTLRQVRVYRPAKS